nr:M28 family metallopeptidase [Nakamurella flavida]
MGSLIVPVSSASALDDVNTKKLRNAVTVNGILAHERVLQRIANRNDGNRASGTQGYAESVDYVKARLEASGYDVTVQEFTFPFFRTLGPSTLAQVSPAAGSYENATLEYSGNGEVTGTVVPAGGIQVPPPETPGVAAGCLPSDFVPASATEDQIALVQRGTCTFAIKTANAVTAGYDAVVVFNEGQPGRDGLLEGVTLGEPVEVPVVGVDYADGAALYAAALAGPVTLQVSTQTEYDPEAVTYNVLADTRKGDPDQVVVVGAHLDSVVAGPGINDNGSGTATILEIAEEMAKLGVAPRKQVRFAFWGAEEAGLLGSEHYVDTLSDDELGTIYANLNFDMVGSPNYVRFVYDGDLSDSELDGAAPPGSAQIETLFTDYFAGQDLATAPTAFDGRSDYGPFITAGIPAGGLFSGAEGIKTEAEAAIFGGTAGVAYDPNYHQAGDTIGNLNTKALAEFGDAAAHAVWTMARSRSGLYEDGSRMARSAPPTKDSFDRWGSDWVR